MTDQTEPRPKTGASSFSMFSFLVVTGSGPMDKSRE
jgi:hypothetical protein